MMERAKKISAVAVLTTIFCSVALSGNAPAQTVRKKPKYMRDFVTLGEYFREEGYYTPERLSNILLKLPARLPYPQYLLPTGVTEEGRTDILHYDTELSEKATLNLIPQPGDYAAVRFSNDAPMRVKAVHLFTVGEPTELTLHIWADKGNYFQPDAENDLTPPIPFTSADKEWQSFALPEPVVFPFLTTFHIAVQHAVEGGAMLALDTDGNTQERSIYYSAKDDIYYLSPGDWAIRLEVEYFNEVETFWFEDITLKSGYPEEAIIVSFGDYDKDGLEDVLISGCSLYKNLGNLLLKEVTEEAGLLGAPCGRGIWADYDNDGYLDFFVFGKEEALWRNKGEGSFERVTEGVPGDDLPTEAAAWLDFDRDGFVDLYLANYEVVPEDGTLGIGTRDALWRNNGDGTFTDVTAKMGMDITTHKGDYFCGRGVTVADFNGNGWPDIYVSNYRLDRNLLWLNLGGRFIEAATDYKIEGVKRVAGLDWSYGHSIGSQWGDLDNDGDWDLVVMNLAHPRFLHFSDLSKVYLSSGGKLPEFTDVYDISDISFAETLSDPSLGDIDNDGFLDLFVTAVYEDRPSFLYKGMGDGTFRDVNYESGVMVYNGWGGAMADLNNDGKLEIASRRLFQNKTTNDKNWLLIKLEGVESNRAAIGAEVRVKAGERLFLRQVEGGKGTGSQSSLILHFGLGYAPVVDELQIKWPSGLIETHRNVEINKYHYFVEGETLNKEDTDAGEGDSAEEEVSGEEELSATPSPLSKQDNGCSCKIRQ